MQGFRTSEGHHVVEWQVWNSPVEAPGLNVQQDLSQHQPPKSLNSMTSCPGWKSQQASGSGPPPLLSFPLPPQFPTQGQYLESRAEFRQPSQFLWLEPSWVHFAISLWCKRVLTVGRGCSFCFNYTRHNYSSRVWKQHRVLWRTSQGFFCYDIVYLWKKKK